MTGRDREIEAFEVLIDRLKAGTAGQSMIVTGLRGVGKTVLLNMFEDIAIDRDWTAVQREFEERTNLPAVIARSARRVLLDLKPGKKIAESIRSTLSGLGTFTVTDPNEFELSYTPSAKASPEQLGEDLTDLLLLLAQAAAAKGGGVVFLFDEVQYVPPEQFGPFVVALHRINQKSLPLTCVAAGLPSLPALAGDAKSYAERLFEYPRIDRLPRDDAVGALREPARARGVDFEQPALDHVVEATDGYPYFLQQYGKYIWDVAPEGRIRLEHAIQGGEEAQARLDDGFFLVRYERATTAERRLLHAMATCDGPPYAIADVTVALGKKDQRGLSVQRDALIKKGLVYAPRHGTVDYTVPRFADYLDRRGPAD